MSAASPIRNAALAASAGTGKTFALSSRYLALLASGAEPASIVALTFTRKAAGEILARILTRLARAAASDQNFKTLNRQLADGHLPGFASRDAARRALRALARNLPGLRIGTLDSFFLQILRQFRLEYGIGTDLAIAADLKDPADNPVLQSLLDHAAMSATEQRELMESFKLATYGEEKKSIYLSLARLVVDQFALFQRAPEPSAWGNPALIWEHGAALLQPPAAPDWPAVFAALAAQAKALRTASEQKAWEKIRENLAGVQGGEEFVPDSALAERLYAALARPGETESSISFNRKEYNLRPEIRRTLAAAFSYIRHSTLLRQIVRTRGLHRLLSAYALQHRAHIARTGLLAFNDISQLLAPSSGRVPAHLRLQMDGRLDARFRHWLFDEFQDTSLVQWAVIENLIDEILQNPDADRTVFYVGDIKQAIYEWRSGDPRLFRRILNKYNRPGRPAAIEELPPLVHSWRSSPVVLEAVNTVFGRLADMPLPPGETLAADWPEIAARWNAEWQPHAAADRNRDLSGQVTVHILPRNGSEEDEPTALVRAARLVQELQQTVPEFNRLSVACLVRGNQEGLDLLAELASRNIRAIWAGNSPLLDNALLPAILSLAKLVEHPGDQFALRHVEMSPLAGAIPLGPDELFAWGRLIRAQGYAGFCARIAARLDLAAAPYERNRLELLTALAAEFDRQPGPTALRFCAFVQAQEVPANQTGSHIQILTMHKAKGLEFDVVILPALGGRGIGAGAQNPLLVHEQDIPAPLPPVEWILAAPAAKIVAAEPPLAAQQAADRRRKALEELRLLYVAMTRAKRALHILTTAPAPHSKTLRLDTVVQNTLAPGGRPDPEQPVYQAGNPAWWRPSPDTEPDRPPCVGPDFQTLPHAPHIRPVESRMASREHGGEGYFGRFFRPEGAAARELGTRIHALFEQIEWLAPGAIPAFPGAGDPDLHLVAAALAVPAVHRLFERPADGPAELYREQAFEALLDGQWLSGKIDRLHLVQDAAGRPVQARIVDFKTDQVPDPERHRFQMEDYRRAVASLFTLPPGQIACTLVFVRTGQAIEL